MSLLYFHIFLITCAALFAIWFGFWEFSAHQLSHHAADLVVGIGALAAGVLLLFYLIWFIRRKLPFMRR